MRFKEFRGFFDTEDRLLTLHAVMVRAQRSVLKIDGTGITHQLESWDSGELVNVEELGRYPLTEIDKAVEAMIAAS